MNLTLPELPATHFSYLVLPSSGLLTILYYQFHYVLKSWPLHNRSRTIMDLPRCLVATKGWYPSPDVCLDHPGAVFLEPERALCPLESYSLLTFS